MTKVFTPFHHPRRECYWCLGGFQPLDTLAPHSTEHFCSAECALESNLSRGSERREALKAQAVQERASRSTEIAQRLKEGREKARALRESEGEDA